jgi:trehalose/maltose transport system substrate-binding protein
MRLAAALAVPLIAVSLACGPQRAREPATVVLFDIGPDKNREYSVWTVRALEGFTRETGIEVKRVLGPEFSNEQLAFERRLLEGRANTPDVYIIDAIWPGTLADHFLDLKPLLGAEVDRHFAALVANNVVRGRLIAIPYHANVGVLFFRTDLLREYGYRAPPGTWPELAAMAAAIQKGERAKGDDGFWGYVWQGAPYEGLTCNALEWQASDGGGNIVENDGTISVNNPRTVSAWERAASWVGTISPAEVVGYRENEARDLWRAGRAAFMRNWPYVAQDPGSRVQGRFDLTFVPAGTRGHAMILGENALAVSRYSRHVDEAVALVKYLSRRDVQIERARATLLPPTVAELYEAPELLMASPYYRPLKNVFLGGALSRPSSAAGHKYGEVSEAYFRAVHSVITRQQKAPAAAAALERQLAWITGFPVTASQPRGAASAR